MRPKRKQVVKKAAKRRPLPRKVAKRTASKPVRVVFLCQAGKYTSKVFARAFKRFLEVRGKARLAKLFNIEHGGPGSDNPKISEIKKADYIYSATHIRSLVFLYKKIHGLDLSGYVETGKIEQIDPLTTLKALNDDPKIEVAVERLQHFFERILSRAEQDFAIMPPK